MKNPYLFGAVFICIGIALGYAFFQNNESPPKVNMAKPSSLSIKGAKQIDLNLDEIDPAKFLASFKTAPVMKSGKIMGYKITWIKKGSAMEGSGLKVGDVIESIGSQKYTSSPTKNAMSLLRSKNNH